MINIQRKENLLAISVFNEHGVSEIVEIEVPQSEMYEWTVARNATDKGVNKVFTSWQGKPIRKRPSNYLNRYRIEEIILNLPEAVRNKIWSSHLPKKNFCDIETAITDEGYSTAEEAKNQVLTICVSNEDDKMFLLGMKPLSKEQVMKMEDKINDYFKNFLKRRLELKYIFFKNEHDMIFDFFNKIMPKIDMLTGWNFIAYDWTYLINRAKRLNIDIRKCSPSGNLVGQERLPEHKLIVDYLEIYKKYDRVIDLKENNTLDFVSEAALGINKIKSKWSLKELYEKDFFEFCYYNAVDTHLVKFMDEKLNTLLTFLKLSDIAKIEHTKAYSPVWMTEALMLREFYKDNKILVNDTSIQQEIRNYAGGYVKKPQSGFYESVVSFDFASLYPTTMRQFNISPETFIKKVADPELYREELKADEILTASGAIFSRDKDSVLRKILENLYGQRKGTKKEMQQLETEIDYLKRKYLG